MAKCEIPVISHNLRKEETVVQIAEVLNHLSSVSENIFKRINERVTKNNEVINSINERIAKAKQKINQISGVKRAIKVFSSCKYPAEDINRKYISVFHDLENIPLKKFPYKYKSLQPKDVPMESLQLYHVDIHQVQDDKCCKGLGEVPDDLTYVNNLLLFNSGINPYNNYIISDTLNIKQSIKKEGFNETSQIVAAPISISDKSGLPKNIEQSYFYAPDLGNVPTINVPLDLPDLPGIADDLRYIDDRAPGIAPSVISPNVPDLPLIEEKEVDSVLNDILPLPQIIQEVEVVKAPQAPLLIEISPLKEIIEDTSNEKIIVPVFEIPVKVSTKKTFDVTDTRANLMEEIRNAGGKRTLRNTIEKESSKAVAAPKGDLMADLHSKLSMRRKGISGNNAENNFDSKTAMEKVSAMIPPPVAQLDTSETTEDEDWDE